MMKTPLHILHLEDDPTDAVIVQSVLEAGGIACATIRAQNRDDFVAALERGGMDLILSDSSMPAFDGMSALKIARAQRPAMPFIFVSGTMSEAQAVDSLQNGATDYVLKEHLSRLAPVVRRAMREVEDRAERQRLETRFIEAQKMEAIGQLAGGVAHDFNNILEVIMGYCDLMTEEFDLDEKIKGYLETIRSASVRAAGLTHQLLGFSRRHKAQLVVLDLNDVVKDLCQMLPRLIDENIEVAVVFGEKTGRVKADPVRIGQVLMNLAINARDAMPNGGKLSITTGNVTLDERHARAHPGAKSGDYVMLSVRDTGTGMTGEVKARLFEAFFTTKPKGKGTGLGLATCQTIVRQFGGHIEVCSEAGQGATFKIYFPRAGQLPRGRETWAAGEDEAFARHLACGVLKAGGYEMLSASNSQGE